MLLAVFFINCGHNRQQTPAIILYQIFKIIWPHLLNKQNESVCILRKHRVDLDLDLDLELDMEDKWNKVNR